MNIVQEKRDVREIGEIFVGKAVEQKASQEMALFQSAFWVCNLLAKICRPR